MHIDSVASYYLDTLDVKQREALKKNESFVQKYKTTFTRKMLIILKLIDPFHLECNRTNIDNICQESTYCLSYGCWIEPIGSSGLSINNQSNNRIFRGLGFLYKRPVWSVRTSESIFDKSFWHFYVVLIWVVL